MQRCSRQRATFSEETPQKQAAAVTDERTNDRCCDETTTESTDSEDRERRRERERDGQIRTWHFPNETSERTDERTALSSSQSRAPRSTCSNRAACCTRWTYFGLDDKVSPILASSLLVTTSVIIRLREYYPNCFDRADRRHAMLTSGSIGGFLPPFFCNRLSFRSPSTVLYTAVEGGRAEGGRDSDSAEKVQSWSAAVDRRRRPRPTPLTLHFRHLIVQ